MPPEGRPLAEYAFTMLELLAREAPQDRFDDVVRQARRAGATDEELARLARAKGHSSDIRRLFGRRQQREAGLAALVDTARDLTKPYNLDILLKVITRRARLLLGLDMSWVSFHDPEAGESLVRASDGHATAITGGFRIPMAGGVGRMAREKSAPFWSPDYLDDDNFPHSGPIDDVVRREGLRAVLAVPLQHENSTFGVLYVADRNVRHFTPGDLSLMASLADLAAVAIERTRLLEQARAEVAELELDTSRALDSSASARRLRNTHNRLLGLVLAGGDLSALVEEGTAAIDGSLLVHDAVGRKLASSRDFPAYDATAVAAAVLDAHGGEGRVRTSDGLWLCPVMAGDENLGTLVLHQGADKTEPAELLDVVAQTVGVLLLIQRSTAIAEGQFRDELFNELLNASQLPPQLLAERARRLAIEVNEPHVIAVARPEGGSQGRALVWAASYAHRLGGLKCADGGRIVLLLPGVDPGAAAHAVSRDLSAVLGHEVTVGCAGPVTDAMAINHTYQEAQRCVDALTALGSTGCTASPGDLGFLGLLLSDSQDILGFLASTIGPVLAYDHQQATELMRTLDAYFTSGGSPTRAAEVLHVHPNTVSRRLERITELLGEDWQVSPQALDVQLALRLHRTRHLLGTDRRPARPTQTVG